MSSARRRSRALQSEKFADKRKKKLIGVIVLACIGIILIIAGFIGLLHAPFVQIKTVEVTGSDASSTPQIQAAVLAELSGAYAYILPRSNSLFYPKNEIEKTLLFTFQDIQSLQFHRAGLSGLNITITERPASALVCEGFPDDSPSDDICFFSDSNGYIFQKIDDSAFNISSSTYMRYYIETDKGDSIIGSDFMDSGEFQNIESFVAGSAKAGIIPTGVLIGDHGQYEMYVKNTLNPSSDSTASEITVYFDNRSPLDTVLSNFTAFWNNTSDLVSSKATTTPNFDYINLRYGNSIFYSTK